MCDLRLQAIAERSGAAEPHKEQPWLFGIVRNR